MSAQEGTAQPWDRARARPEVDGGRYPTVRQGAPPPRRPSEGSMAPGVTLTGVGAVLLMAVAAAVGAIIDILLGPALGTATTIMLAVATLTAAWLVRRRNLFSVVVAPPLVYLLLAVAALLLASDLGVTLTNLAATLVYGFPAMAIATALGVLVAAIRQISGR